MTPKIRILFLEDDPSDAQLLEWELERSGIPFVSKRVDNRDAFMHELLSSPPDLILSDYSLPGFDGMEALHLLKQYHPHIPFIVVTGAINEETAVECIKSGAEDYVIKDRPRRLAQAVQGAMVKRMAMEEKAKAEQALQESERRYRRLFESAQEGILLLDAETGRIADINPFAMGLLDADKGTMQGRGLHEAGFVPDEGTARDLLRKCGAEGHIEYEGDVAQPIRGRSIHIEMSCNAAVMDGKSVVQCNVRDVTRRKLAEEEKQSIQAQLFQSQKMEAIGAVAGGVAHDFNNLMTAIQISTDLAMMKFDESHEHYRELKEIRQSAMRATGLIRQLMLFSRKHPMEFKTLDLNQTVEALLAMLQRLIGEDIEIHSELDPALEPVRADASNVEQVIMNLVLNARDAMPKGGRLLVRTENVQLEARDCQAFSGVQPGSYVLLSVSDTGIGMDKQTLEHIFEPFFTTKVPGKGTGLGLSVVYGIVRQHEGAIRVTSEPAQGSTFEVVLPASPRESGAGTETASSHLVFAGRGQHILLVEDEEKVRESAAKAMAKCGYRVTVAVDVQTALEAVRRENGQFDLVFSDVVLSDRTGIDLADELLRVHPGLKILLSSGYSDQKSQWPAIRKRGFKFLQKPYDLTAMLRAVHDALK
jgi:PAS domain S-box-containing protein